jgi:hypothetical protein
MSEDSEQLVFGFTRDEWTQAFAFDTTDDEAAKQAAEVFARHREFGSDGFVFDHHDLLRLAYVSPDCRARVLAQVSGPDTSWNLLLDKLRQMDRDARASGLLRHPPASDPL